MEKLTVNLKYDQYYCWKSIYSVVPWRTYTPVDRILMLFWYKLNSKLADWHRPYNENKYGVYVKETKTKNKKHWDENVGQRPPLGLQ